MSEKHDIYLRAHTVVLDDPEPRTKGTNRPRLDLPKWPELALVFDCESRIDITQELTFGFYRVLKLKGDAYALDEEGAFSDADLPADERRTLEEYVSSEDPDVTSFPPGFPLHSRSEFIKNVFYKYARKGAVIVGFNICYDLARLARRWPAGDRDEWSLVLSEFPDGNENLHHPRVLIKPIDSHKAFIRFATEWVPKDGTAKPTKIHEARFLDLRTLLWALFHKSLSLKAACELETFKKHNLLQKEDHTPTGRVTVAEIKYAHQDVRCTAALLNAAKQEFDLHPISLAPNRAFSPASLIKAYLDELGVTPPAAKFNVPNEILGIAMESYTGGRSETRIRHVEVPVAPVDFTSEYPTVCALMELMEVLTADSLSFEDATADVQKMLAAVSLDKCFSRKLWPKFRVFVLLKPDRDVFPIRKMQNGLTQAIATDYLTSDKPIWFAGPDVINSVLQTGKIPNIVRALRLVPHGTQTDMKTVHFRGAVKIDPHRDDLFRKIIEERKRHKSNEDLSHSLKILANAICGCFTEINPGPTPKAKPVRVRVYSGEDCFVPDKRYDFIERHGKWYAPYLGSLITAGGRLLLGMAERCVADEGGVHAWADTDALAIVSSEEPGQLTHVPGGENLRALPRESVQGIIDKFSRLNPYKFRGSILNFTDDNYVDFDPENGFRQLLGFSISAKRYTLYERDGDGLAIVNPKAHGLGYLNPPADSPPGWDDEQDVPYWIYEAWEYLLRVTFRLTPNPPSWLKRPQMMRIAVTTQNVLKRVEGWAGCRPYNLFSMPMLAVGGCPANTDPNYFTLAAPFEKDQKKWMDLVCVNIDDLNDTREYRLTTDFSSRYYGERAVVDTLQNLLHRYLHHPESKSIAPTGGPCRYYTRGLLQRAHIIAGKHRRIGKETDRHWEEGDDLESARFRPIEYERESARPSRYARVVASKTLARQVKAIGIRKLARFIGCGRRILRKICRRQLVRASTLAEYESMIQRYKLTQPRLGRSL